jgi:hypothetical protein
VATDASEAAGLGYRYFMMPLSGRVAIGCVAVVAAVAVPTAAGAAATSATALLRHSAMTSNAEPSFHYVSTGTVGTHTVTITGDVSRTMGSQQIVDDDDGHRGHVTVSIVGGSAYFRGDEAGLSGFMGFSPTLAAQYADKWLMVSSDSSAYMALAAALTTASALQQIEIGTSVKLQGDTTKNGTKVTNIAGTYSATPSGSTKPTTASVHVYVATSPTHLPVLYTASTVQSGGKRAVEKLSFSKWGEPVNVTAPVGAIPAGSGTQKGTTA